MRVLVATTELQGLLASDYAYTVEGELVVAEVAECASPEKCGCGRGFPGLASNHATTTAMIADLPHVTESELRDVIADWLDRSGWTELLEAAGHTDDEVAATLDEIIDEHVETIGLICSSFDVGTVIERSGTTVSARMAPRAA